MLIPVRCYTCGKIIGDKWEHYNDLLSQGKTQPQAFEILKLKRYCCKRIIMGHVDVIDILMSYDVNMIKNESMVYTLNEEFKNDDASLFSV
jgi:DNA-directed RNA polymerase I, II, and III subunit RPABC5